MADVFSPEKRSEVMSRIRSRWTKQERIVHNHLKGNRIRHRMHPKMEGSPDIILKGKKIVIFLDGCFWHRCPKCYREPASRREFWIPKIEKNVRRDRATDRNLKRAGWKVVRIWEHEAGSDPAGVAKRIKNMATK